jgi:hypothetical protein
VTARVVLHVLKIWTACSLVCLAFWAAVAGGFALTQQQWRDRLTGRVHPVTVTVTGQSRNGDGCGSRVRTPGWDWHATWTDHGRTRHGVLGECAAAPPTGTKVRTLVTADGHLGGDTTENYYFWWPIISVGMGAMLSVAWLTGRGAARFRSIRAAARRERSSTPGR